MKRIALFILVTLLCMAIVLSAFAGEWLPVVAALRTNANLRAAPSAEAKSKMILMKGTQVTVVRVEGTWLEVRYGNYSGYIRGDLVEGDIPYGALPGPAEKPVVISSGTDTRPVLRMGMRGVEVYDLQAFLLALGFDIGKPDGIFGETTKEAVREFQWEYGLPADGVVGKDTYDRMEYALAGGVPAGAPTGAYAPQATVGLQASAVPPAVITRTLKNGVTGGDVLLLNQRLETLGYVSYATNTYNTAAVKAFQQRNGLVADGIAGSKTQSVLFSGWAIAAPGIPLPAASPAAGPSAPVNRVLRAGMTGSDVLAVNQRLEQLGYISAAASVYMESAVTAFQARNGLPADGVIGAATLNRLYSSSAVGMPSGAQPAAMPQPVSTQYAFTRTLYAGMTGPDVLALNERLVSLGYLVNSANLYDASAVRAFQQRNGLVADGIAGPLTVGRLFSAVAVSAATPVVSQGSGAGSLQYGDRGEAVRTLQRALRQTGYYTEGIDGDFGAATRMAVGLFQKTNGLSETGVADAQTQALLYGGRAQPAPVPTPFVPDYPGAGAMANPPRASQVVYANWDREIKPGYSAGQIITVYDYNARLAWQLRLYALGEHADSEPLTAQDTEIMFRAFGLKNTWTPRPVWAIMPDGRVYMASIHNMPHLTSSIKNNNFDGHLCVHFPRDMSAAQAVGSYAVTHQNCILSGWQATQGMR